MLPELNVSSVVAFHRYLLAGLKWINSVLQRWGGELKAAGCSRSTKDLVDMYVSCNQVTGLSTPALWKMKYVLIIMDCCKQHITV